MKCFWLCIATATIVSITISPAHAYNGKKLNAKAVSVNYLNGGSLCGSADESVHKGSIVLYTIQNSVVTRADTIHKRTNSYATYPAFNLAGTKIAFFRFGQAAGPSGNCVTANGGKSYISIINPDGSGLVDLCELPALPSGVIFILDWPAGDWIYYEKPHATTTYDGNSSLMIWRVNAVTQATEKVCNLTHNGSDAELTCSYLHRFTMALDGKHCAFMTYPKLGCQSESSAEFQFFAHVNGIYKFPPPNGNLSGSTCVGWRDGCNASISPSGKIVANYFAGWHDDMQMGTPNYATAKGGAIGNDDPSVGLPVSSYDDCGHVWINPNTNSGCPMCMETSKGNLTKWNGGAYIGQGAELIRWSVNSDKWVMQKIGNYKDGHASSNNNGSNQVVVNFMDSVAINISKNPVPPHNSPDDPVQAPYGTIFWNNCAGDLWVDDPVNNPNKNKYEDLKGAWISIPGTAQQNPEHIQNESGSVVVMSAYRNGKDASLLIHITQQEAWKATIAGVDGRTIRSLAGKGAGDVAVSAAGISGGICVITLSQGGKHFVNRCVVR